MRCAIGLEKESVEETAEFEGEEEDGTEGFKIKRRL